MRVHKRSQTEIMGLMIIVVILSLALLFVLKVVFTKSSAEQTTQSYETKNLVTAFVNTLFQTSSGCTSDTDIQDLLVDCAKNPFSGGTIACIDGRSSCEYANATIAYILENSIDQWSFGKGYEFVAVAPPNQRIIYHSAGNLSASTGGDTTPFSLPLYPSSQQLYVYLCIGGCGLS